jgi:hypothetical protein
MESAYGMAKYHCCFLIRSCVGVERIRYEGIESMKTSLQNLFSPVLGYFESGEGSYSYKGSHRTILVVIGVLFLLLSFVSLAAAIVTLQLAAGLPFLIFFGAGAVCIIVGGLGSNRAVAKLWGNSNG